MQRPTLRLEDQQYRCDLPSDIEDDQCLIFHIPKPKGHHLALPVSLNSFLPPGGGGSVEA